MVTLMNKNDEDGDENKQYDVEEEYDDDNSFTCDWNLAKPLTVYRDFL